MGWRGVLRDLQAASRRAERAAYRQQRVLEKQRQQFERMQEREQNAYEVEVYENQIELLTSVHKECGEVWDWKAIREAPPPDIPDRSDKHERRARSSLLHYEPSFLDRIFRRSESKREELEEAIEAARRNDQEDYHRSLQTYQRDKAGWEHSRRFAARVLAGDIDAYVEAIQETNPFSDLSLLGSSLRFRISSPYVVQATLHTNGQRAIPSEIKTLLKTGKVSVKAMPKSRFYEIYQDYVCGCVLRVGRELFALLPIRMVIVTALGEILNSQTGHLEERPILSIAIPRKTTSQIRWETVDPSDTLTNFIHRISFKRGKGLSAVEPIGLSELRLE